MTFHPLSSLQFSEPFKVGQKAKIVIRMTYAGSKKGAFVYGNIYGSFQYETALAGGSCTELQTVEKKDELQLAFKMYSQAGTLLMHSVSDLCKFVSSFHNLRIFFQKGAQLLTGEGRERDGGGTGEGGAFCIFSNVLHWKVKCEKITEALG